MDEDLDLFNVFEDQPTGSRDQVVEKGGGDVLSVEDATAGSETEEQPVADMITIHDLSDDDDVVEVSPNKRQKLEPAQEKMEQDVDDESEVEEEIDKTVQLERMVPRVEIHELETDGCLHEVVIPCDLTYVPLKVMSSTPGYKPAKNYEFTLDPFQREAILCVENDQSVLVSAHTSAGKTVVAEYAIAQSLKAKQRVVYTTPIKALSNQKYREFYEEFRDVGLITGDVTINPTASCLIMTTEILRLMLFRGSEIMREVGWVVFDEIHYMRDKERGVVWEETIILLPDKVHYVFLSATIPNARQFAEWIAHLHQQTCHVVYTDYRPTPLQHYIFPSGGDGLHLVLDERGNFKEENFNKAINSLHAAGDAAKGDQQLRGRKGGQKGESNCLKVVRTIMERDLAPVIVFSFSKKECEAYALSMSKLDFNTADEKESVREVFNNAIDVLSEEDKKLPQVDHILPLLERGIGIHHGGLLPLIKETIEILFGEGLIKALFATETFAMGLNMPARTVVFTNAQKFDGQEMRWLTSGEYIQMSGRAGRRGLDDKGIVILMIDDKMSPSVGKDLIKGKPDVLNSAFHLTYNMVLNLLRVDDVNPEYMLQHSFHQFQQYSKVPELIEKERSLQQKIDSVEIKDENKLNDYFNIKNQLTTLSNRFNVFLRKPKYLVPFLQPGRLLHVVSMDQKDLGWGCVINFHKKQARKRNEVELETYTIDILLHLDKDCDPRLGQYYAPPTGSKGEMKVCTIGFDNVIQVSSVRIYPPDDCRNRDQRQSVLKSITECLKQFNNKVPLLDPIEDMKIKESEFTSLVKKIESFESRLLTFDISDTKTVELFQQKRKLLDQIEQVHKELKEAQSLIQMDELKCRKRVLRRLGYCTAADVIEIKGRVACEITRFVIIYFDYI